ncbi:MAG TPA: hypothetical protein PK095_04390, partial [Myxococcota bacterium]|nr:hypothetical protein [Myxococcota bacterium]
VESTCCVGCRAASVCLAGYCASACETVASVCPAIESVDASVCGCDGVTYANACEAGRADVDLASDETCEAVSCADDGDCAPDETCEREAGDCGATDRERRGVCVELPDECLAVVSPVCGCDGVAYTNDCERRRAGVGLSARGACVSAEPR